MKIHQIKKSFQRIGVHVGTAALAITVSLALILGGFHLMGSSWIDYNANLKAYFILETMGPFDRFILYTLNFPHRREL